MKPLETAVTPKAAKEHIEAHVRYLSGPAGAIPIVLTNEWTKGYPPKPGVYAVFDEKKLIYVGETGSLQGRMKDLRDTRNHTLRCQLGAAKFSDRPGYQPATSKKKFTDSIEVLLNAYIKQHLSVKAIPVVLGRTEIEELLIDRETPRFNTKSRRGEADESVGL